MSLEAHSPPPDFTRAAHAPGDYLGGMAAPSPHQPVRAKPLLRGVLHQAAFMVSLVLGTLLIVGAEGAPRHAAAAVFAGSVAACFGASALYHRVTWTPRLRIWMRRIDHAGVHLLIAGTYTPICLLVLDGAWRLVLLAIVWVGAAAAIVYARRRPNPAPAVLGYHELFHALTVVAVACQYVAIAWGALIRSSCK